MRFSSLLLLAAPLLVSAVDIYVNASNTAGALQYFPSNVTANKGDRIIFFFYPQNHSVVAGQFDTPCRPLQDTNNGDTNVYFYSGFWPSSSGMNNTAFVYNVETTEPLYFYCSYGSHCQQGMVGAINPPTSGDHTLERYRANAANANENVTPTGVLARPGYGGELIQANQIQNVTSTVTRVSGTSTSVSTATSATAPTTNAAPAARVTMMAEMFGAMGAAALGYAL